MQHIVDFLNSHASCRKFSNKEISEADEMTIVSTAQRSATSSNLQAFSILGIRDPQKKQQLAEWSGNQQHIIDSSLFLIFCADLYRLRLLNEQKGYNFTGEYTELFIVATVDAALAGCRALMTAQALGMGGVMVGGIRNNPDKVGELLGLPELTYPVFGMSLGYPEKTPTIKPRLSPTTVYHRKAYSTDNYSSDIEQYDKVIDEIGYLKGREVQPEKYPDFSGVYSWSEHTARRMANENAARKHMFDYLRSQGFLKN